MTTLDQAKTVLDSQSFRSDFMRGHGKANNRDMLTRQQASPRRGLSDQEISDIYASNRIVQNIIDIPAEDMTRSGWTLELKDKTLKDRLESKMKQLDLQDNLRQMRVFERLRGDGFVSIGVTQKNKFALSDPLNEENIKSIDYLNAFSSMKVESFLLNDDVFSNQYGTVSSFKLLPSKNFVGVSSQVVHSSRVLHDQTRRLETDREGQSLLEPMWDVITVMDTALWSVGQILYDYTFKVYKSKDIDGMNTEDKQQLGSILDFMFRTEAVALIANDEELTKQSTQVSGIKDLLDFVWDYLAGVARMPKTVIKGQEAGTLTGAQYDVMNYYSRIAAMQENELRPKLNRMVRLLMRSEEFGVNPDKIDWTFKFNPLWSVDSKTDAEIRKLLAESDKIYIENAVLTAEEVRKERFKMLDSSGQGKFGGDAADLSQMAEEIYKKFLKAHQNG